MIANQRICVVLPAYNAGRTLEATFKEIPAEVVDDLGRFGVDHRHRRGFGHPGSDARLAEATAPSASWEPEPAEPG